MEERRKIWLEKLLKIEDPVLDALEQEKLKESIPSAFHTERMKYASLEAFGRSMMGLAPWLEADSSTLSEEERKLQAAYREKAIACIGHAVDPKSPDFMNFCDGDQPLVDAAFLAHALVRAPKALAAALPPETRQNLAAALVSSRRIAAYPTNWILFSAMVEAGLYVLGEPYDIMRVLYALRTFQAWYKGDGIYGDGQNFHWDYYNSFVIQPMYVDLVTLFAKENREIAAMQQSVISRASRFASQLERMIGPDGTYPVIGRSICYRFGVFQMLAQAALQHRLEEGLTPASVRCALQAVIGRVMSAGDMFDEKGWLRPGVYGYQPELAEPYICTGSLYLCSTVFLPLGLPADDPFWTAEDEDWSGKKVWSGGHIRIDHAID
jgi:hypothetical protein